MTLKLLHSSIVFTNLTSDEIFLMASILQLSRIAIFVPGLITCSTIVVMLLSIMQLCNIFMKLKASDMILACDDYGEKKVPHITQISACLQLLIHVIFHPIML